MAIEDFPPGVVEPSSNGVGGLEVPCFPQRRALGGEALGLVPVQV